MASAVYPWQYRWLHAHVRRAGPVRDAHLPLGEGLHVLYGRNGAGKSSVLNALMGRADAAVVVESTRLDEAYAHKVPPEYRFDVQSHLVNLLTDVVQRASAFELPASSPTFDVSDVEALADEFIASPYWVIDGSSLYPVVRLSEETPIASRAAAFSAAVYDAWEKTTSPDNEDGDHDLATCKENWVPVRDLWTEMLDGRPFQSLDRPPFVCMPYVWASEEVLGSVVMGSSTSILADVAKTHDPVDVGEATVAAFTEVATRSGLTRETLRADYWESAPFWDACDALEEQVNGIFASLLMDAPVLKLTRHEPLDWLMKGLVEWQVQGITEKYSSGLLSLDCLSSAESRWARIAIAVAIDHLLDHFTVLLLDEPELGLHRTAESHMVRGLSDIASGRSSLVVVATHSPEMLDAPGARLHHVSSPSKAEASGISSLKSVEVEDLKALGLNTADLLRRHKVFLLVEGLHDQIVLDEWFAEELAEARVQIVPLHGGARLAASIDSFMTFEYTDAKIIAVLDNVKAVHVENVWRQGCEVLAREGAAAAGDFMRAELGPRAKSENRYIADFFAAAALKGDVLSKVQVTGLTEADVLHYLPVSAFTPRGATGIRSWADVKSAHASSGTKNNNVKQWMTGRYGASFDEAAIRRAARLVERPHDDFYALLELCKRISR
ncbi:AAA family ATPase [Pseudokineococcus lusitanus]|uniref:AAA domain-containing protein n=1 Tax=Pseudokineococcus lusitanus TaxID=763993 RepID=A0A3N1HQG1_9ACTN|nr:AAA family ATPase [Pseudokineococcus lusitanus]ROP44669.1 AAA domain-containing protein [Pseudokineococcus lusitanus]